MTNPAFKIKWARRDLNSHGLPRRILSPFLPRHDHALTCNFKHKSKRLFALLGTSMNVSETNFGIFSATEAR